MPATTLGLLIWVAAATSSLIHVPQDSFTPLVDGQVESARAARSLSSALAATVRASDLRSDRVGSSLVLRGKVWSSGESEGGRGACHVQWTLTGFDGSPVGVWSAVAPSYREIISTMPGSGLDQPDGLSGEIWKTCVWAARLNKAFKSQNLDIELFDSQSGESVPAAKIRSNDSRDLRISCYGPALGSLCLFVFQGKEVVANEVVQLNGRRRAVFQARWNPAFGQNILIVHTKDKMSPSALPQGIISRSYSLGIIGALHNEGPLTVWESLSQNCEVLGWRIL